MSTATISVASDEALASHMLAQNPNPILRLSSTAEVLYANLAAKKVLQQLAAIEGDCPMQYLLDLVSHSIVKSTQEIALAGHHYLLTIVSELQSHSFYFTDITERYKAEQRQAAERDFFETVLYHLPTGVATFDVKHRFQYLNPSAIRNDEIREWIVGKNNFEYCTHFNHPRALAVLRQEMFERAVQEETEVRWEETFQSSSGPRHWLRLYTPIFHPNGTLRLVVGSSADITEQYLAEQTVQQAQYETKATVQVRESFLTNTSHKIRTPMVGVPNIANCQALR
ncbi:PAS domain-containing protein [uncultured Hymenobacter sp.]|uniref:PAS domain-containing protein n=1 Tax=uncultured Hymenobacter sp. TaxID=170016 RepID=UPI0035CC155F